MRTRDRQIIESIRQFRVLSRDQIARMYFGHLKSPTTSANFVLKRLRRDGHIEVATDRQPYLYFAAPTPMRKDSQKIPHFLAIAEFYAEIRKAGKLRKFVVEPKYGSDFMEPDAFTIWNGAPFFVEIQRNAYSRKVMAAKLARYEAYYHSGDWRKESWQPKGKAPIFPYVWFVTETRYNLPRTPFRIFQTRDVAEFLSAQKTS